MAATKKPAANAKPAAKPASKNNAKTAGPAAASEASALAKAVAQKKTPNQINTVAAYKAYTDDDATRVDGWAMRWEVIEEEEGFNPRDYNDPDVVAHIRRMADGYKRGDVFPHLLIVVRNGTVYIRDGHCRLRAIKLAVSEGAKIGKVPVVEVKGDEIAQSDVVLITQDGLKLKALERAAHYVKYHNWGMNDAEIGKRFNKTGEHVRQYRSMLELPIALKKLITDGTITPTLALELYKEHGGDAAVLVNKAAEVQLQEIEEQKAKASVLAVAAMVTGDLLEPVEGSTNVNSEVQAAIAETGSAESSADVSPAAESTDQTEAPAPAPAAQEPTNAAVKPAAKPKVTKKHINKVVGTSPKLSSQVVAAMTRTFTGLSSRVESVRVIDDKYFLEISSEDLALLQELKAQIAGVTDQKPASDPNQLDILENVEDSNNAAA